MSRGVGVGVYLGNSSKQLSISLISLWDSGASTVLRGDKARKLSRIQNYLKSFEIEVEILETLLCCGAMERMF